MTVPTPTLFPSPAPLPERVSFDRKELGVILSVYGRMVAAGEWRDYGIAALPEVAIFSIFRRTSEVLPLMPILRPAPDQPRHLVTKGQALPPPRRCLS